MNLRIIGIAGAVGFTLTAFLFGATHPALAITACVETACCTALAAIPQPPKKH